MSRLTLADRLSAAAVGLFFGAFIGLGLAWIAGVYSSRHGASDIAVNFKQWVGYCALGFGSVGLLMGPFVGNLLGSLINGIFQYESDDQDHYEVDFPTWLAVIIFCGVVTGILWLAS
jgi:MFS family permease